MDRSFPKPLFPIEPRVWNHMSLTQTRMADGLNHARAMRLAEVMQDFRNLQHYIAQIRISPSPEEYYKEGYTLLRQCLSEGSAVLNAPFTASQNAPNGDPEQEKAHLRYVFYDASARRFQAQKIYLRATAAMRWINSRNAVLQGQKETQAHQAALRVVDGTLRTELASITDEKVMNDLRSEDRRQSKWTDEDPTLVGLQQWLASRR